MIGSTGFSGIQSFPAHQEVVEFVRWAIEEGVKDVVLIDEHDLFGYELDDDTLEIEQPRQQPE